MSELERRQLPKEGARSPGREHYPHSSCRFRTWFSERNRRAEYAQNNPSGAGEECSAAYDRVPGRQGLLSKRRRKLTSSPVPDALAGPDGSDAVGEDAKQRVRTRLDPRRPVGAAGAGDLATRPRGRASGRASHDPRVSLRKRGQLVRHLGNLDEEDQTMGNSAGQDIDPTFLPQSVGRDKRAARAAGLRGRVRPRGAAAGRAGRARH